MILSFVESRIPVFIAIPGIKMGLANIAIIFALYRLGAKEAFVISIIRIIVVSMLFGSIVSVAYSIGGAIFSFAVMLILKKLSVFSEVGISVAGGVSHNIGQILVACILLETNVIVYYLPFLLLSGVISGALIGIVSAIVIKRVNIKR